MLRLIGVLIVLCLQLAACEDDQWREFRSEAEGFSVSLPQAPATRSKHIEEGNVTEKNFFVQLPQAGYLVTVVQTEPGRGRKNPDQAYFQDLMQHYVHGSQTKLRTSKAAIVAGRPGLEAITDDGQFSHQLQITASGDRVYTLIYIGPKAQENAPELKRFRDSFKLLN